MKDRRMRPVTLALTVMLTLLLALAGAQSAAAQGKSQGKSQGKAGQGKATPKKNANANCAQGRTLPASKISIQLWTFNRYIGSGQLLPGAPADAPGATATQAQRLEYVLAYLSELGFRNIEPYSFHGLTFEQFDALVQKYGLKVPSRHMSTNEANWATNLEQAKILGQRWTGSGGFAAPGIGSYANVLATAETLNRLGRLSVQNGTGPIFGHNHAGEFTTRYVDPATGELKSAWQILVENTDPRYVTFQLDVGWAAIAGEDPVALIEEFGDRIELLHVKDVADIGLATQRQVTVGQGDIDWAAVFEAAQGDVKMFVLEQDPPVEPFSFAAQSFQYIDCLVY